MKRAVSGPKNTTSTDSQPVISEAVWARAKFAMCIKPDDNVDLVKLKVYRIIHDRDSLRCGMLRIVDESGDDYLYSIDRFVPVNITSTAQNQLVNQKIDLVRSIPNNASVKSNRKIARHSTS